ncbi:hypothetical protein WMY93_032276, partial [Mugilogobius chulae]
RLFSFWSVRSGQSILELHLRLHVQTLKEVSKVFPDSYIHLGGDEVDFTCWKTNPDIKAFMQSKGFGSDFTKLEAFYMESIVNMTTALNRTAIVWQDVFDYHEKRSFLSVVEVWRQPCYLCKMRRATKVGLRVILAAPWYLDQPGPTHNWAPFYNVRPLNFKGQNECCAIPKSSVLHIWKGLPPAYYAEMEQMTQAGMRVILAAPWYINHINYGQDWRTYYGVEPLNFNGVCS